MTPRIENLPEIRLIGRRTTMSFAGDRTRELWQIFMPHRKEIRSAAGPELYSVQIYPDTTFFEHFDPARTFVKWAAIRIVDFDSVPEGMETLVIPAGFYAVFHYRGKPSEAQATFRYIFDTWLPNSHYQPDDRPHIALMGAGYKGEDPESEEEFWVPVKEKGSDFQH